MGRSGRLGIVLTLFAAAVVGIFFAVQALLSGPPTVTYTPDAQGQVNATLETVGSYGLAPHPTWVSYLIRSPAGNWVHTTIWQVPAHTRINVTIYQFDSGSPLRNQEVGQVAGTIGGTMTLNGKSISVFNSNAGNGVGHTFSIPTLGINVPLVGNNANATLCAVAPCEPTSTQYPHNTITFSFVSPGAGSYPWQCFVPCGLGYLFGNAGPMQTMGYMDGFLKVV
jgi:hypothetical protein